jgi:hypothetical protein
MIFHPRGGVRGSGQLLLPRRGFAILRSALPTTRIDLCYQEMVTWREFSNSSAF